MRNKEAVKKLLGLLKDYRKIIALIIACLLISTGLNMCIPLLNRGIIYTFLFRFFEQHQRSEKLCKHAAPVNVSHKKHRCAALGFA